MSEPKIWLLSFFCTVGIVLAFVGGFTVLTDPMWYFDHQNQWNQVQHPFNERQQKTNWLASHPANYDTLLLGSSRASYLNQYEFHQGDCYNYSVSSMKPAEFGEYLSFFISKNSKSLKKVYIGLDFFGTNTFAKFDFDEPSTIISHATSNGYFFKMLFNLDNFLQGWKNLIFHRDYYDRSNVKNSVCPEKKEDQLATYCREVYGKYEYDSSYKDHLQNLKRNFPEIDFHIFTTPVSEELLQTLEFCQREGDYLRWLQDIEEVFGSFDHMMVHGWQEEDFLDAHHPSTTGANKIIRLLEKDQ